MSMAATEDQKLNVSVKADERTPLLATALAGPTAQTNEEGLQLRQGDPENDDTPLPKGQVVLLCYARMAEPIAFFSIFPFVNKMIYETGDVDEADVGFYSGLIESLFSLTQMLLMISWGHAADRFGRKPVLTISLIGLGTGTLLFGLSKSIWQMILFRCIAGIFAGTLVTIRAMFSEISTPRTQARAFSFFAFSGNLGIFFGPLIGGGLSNPVDQYPSTFGHSQFFKDYPYALATLVSGLFAASAALVNFFFLKETLRPKDKEEATLKPMSTLDVVRSPGVPIVLFLYGHTMLIALAYTAVVPVFWFTDPELGGFGFSPLQISAFLGAAGISQALWTLLVFPPLQRRVGTGGVLRICYACWPLMFILSPLCTIFIRRHMDPAFWTAAVISTVGGSGVSMAFTGVQLALNDISPSHATLGTLNAVALTLVSGIRAVAPALFASLFATGVRNHILSGLFIWPVLVILAICPIVAVRYLPAKAEGRVKLKPSHED